jgi:hypothetical protein
MPARTLAIECWALVLLATYLPGYLPIYPLERQARDGVGVCAALAKVGAAPDPSRAFLEAWPLKLTVPC